MISCLIFFAVAGTALIAAQVTTPHPEQSTAVEPYQTPTAASNR